MKSSKTAFCAALMLAGSAILSQAQTYVHFTGSTAFRAAAVTAIHNAFDGSPAVKFAYNGTSETGANVQIYSGFISGSAVIIKCTWTGSEAGNQTVSQNGTGLAINFVQDVPYAGGSPVALTTGGTQNIEDPTVSGFVQAHFESDIPDVAMSDSYQSTSQFFTTGNNTYHGNTYPAEFPANVTPAGIVGVIPFKFVANPASTLTAITDFQARALYGKGRMTKALFTGSNSDETSYVYAIGRDPDSGTRVTQLSDINYGALNSVVQNELLDSSGNLIITTGTAIASITYWPTETVDGITINAKNGGYNSGGKMMKAISNNPTGSTNITQGTFSSTGGDLLSYASVFDADPVITGNGVKELAFNGVTLGNVGGNYNNSTAITEGSYTFWGYEHMYYRSATNGTTIGNIADKIALSIQTTYAPVLLTNMRVTRATDGAPVTPSYNY